MEFETGTHYVSDSVAFNMFHLFYGIFST